MENHSACFRLSFPSTLQGVAYGDVDAYRIFFRWLFRAEPEDCCCAYGDNDVQLDGVYP